MRFLILLRVEREAKRDVNEKRTSNTTSELKKASSQLIAHRESERMGNERESRRFDHFLLKKQRALSCGNSRTFLGKKSRTTLEHSKILIHFAYTQLTSPVK